MPTTPSPKLHSPGPMDIASPCRPRLYGPNTGSTPADTEMSSPTYSRSPSQERLQLFSSLSSSTGYSEDSMPTPDLCLADIEPSASVSCMSTDVHMCSGHGLSMSRPQYPVRPVGASPPVGNIFRPWVGQAQGDASTYTWASATSVGRIEAMYPPSFIKRRWAGLPPRPVPRGMKPRCLFPQRDASIIMEEDNLSLSVIDLDATPRHVTAANRLHHERTVVGSFGLNPDRDTSLADFLEDVFIAPIPESPSPSKLPPKKRPLDNDSSPKAKRRKLGCARYLF